MAKEICISTTPHETRLAIIEDDQLAEIYYERENEYTLAGSIYKGRVTRVLPGMQSSFVDVGLERDAFLYVTDFLEDSEDSDEYETSTPASGARRTSERNGERSGERNGDRQPAEEQAAAPAEEKRGRREGRRDGRDGNRGESRRNERPEPQTPASPAMTPAATERAVAAAALRTAQPSETDREAKGDDEETPEGTRRWRGRRGRRRGGVRAGVLGAAALPANPGDLADELSQTATAPFDLPEHGAPGGLAAPLHIAAADPAEEPETIDLQASAAPLPAAIDEPRRGTRGGRSGREAREPREARAGRERTEAAPASPAAIVLPGESLSKYGAAPAASPTKPEAKLALPTRPVNYVAPKPGTEFDLKLSGWDGGLVLPGETLSRHRKEAAGTASRSAVEPAPQGSEAEPLPEAAAMESEIETALKTALSAGTVAGETAPPETIAEALPETAQAEYLATTAEPIDEAAQTEQAVQESEGGEYEPKDGEASVRMSPPVTRELRLSQLFGMGDKGDDKQEPAPDSPPDPELAHAEQPPVRTTLDAGREAPLPETSSSLEPFVAEDASHGTPPVPQPLDRPASVKFAPTESEPASRREDRKASFETHAEAEFDAVEVTEHQAAAHGDGFAELVDQLQGFAPGTGHLEEEVIDEDEYDFDPVHAHTDEHDLEELEEETMDGAEYPEPAFAMTEPGEPESDKGLFRMETASAIAELHEAEEDDEDPAAFALEEVDEDEEEPAAAGNGEPRRERSGEDRGRRGGRNSGGRRRGVGGAAAGGVGRRAQTQDLPIISDLLKQGQEILVQIAKEPIAKKGARITSHIALPGRFLVFMPTVHHVGVSRKIASDEERQRLKRILVSERGEHTGGFIVRTAAEGASEEELRADLRFLISLWTEIKQRADTAKAPALIYHDLNLVERILRDQVSSNFSTIWVDTEQEYERIVRFLNRFQPALVRRVKLYTKETPLFEHFGIQEEISKALKSKVWLKSGGSIVINQTEALVAIDINTGKYVGKTARLEDTIVKTNLDAIPEIVRQIRLRDLGGIIVIDFIDMDERKNRHRVLAALEEAMKADRAPSKVLQFNDFGLVAITRKRVKQSLERTLSVTCETCEGTGMVKSPITVCNEIYIELRKMQKHLEGKDVMLRVHPEVVKQLKGGSGRWINEYEEMVGKTIIIKSDPALHPEQFDIH